jgi:hypothetical protein
MIFEFENALKEKDLDLYVQYRDIKRRAVPGFQKYASWLGELPDCGEQHCQNVLENVDRLVPDNIKRQMPPREIFVLLCAIQFHEIGLLAEKEEQESLSSILRDYPERTYDYIHQYYKDWGLTPAQARLIKNVCIGLSNSRFKLLPEYEVLHRAKIRVRFLAAVLRLGNILDVDYTRVSSFVSKLRRLSPESKRQWLKYSDIGGIEIDSDRWKIALHVAPETVESRRLLDEFVHDELQLELEFVHDILDKNGLYYRTAEMKLAHEIAARDKRVSRALEDLYEIHKETETTTKPYKFLDYFDPSDRAIFFGRDPDIARFSGYIKTRKLVVLYGESGVGKTSLIRAGLIPKLVQEGSVPVYTRCIENPIDVVREEVSSVVSLLDHAPATQTKGLRDFFENPSLKGYEFVIFIDQFEEFFIRFPTEIRDRFINNIIDCISENSSVHATFVLSLRREKFVELGEYKNRLLELYNNAYELRKLTREEVREAVIGPAREHGLLYEEGIVDRLIDDIYHGGEYNTPHIQIVCDKLVRSLVPDAQVITKDLYEQLGGASKILSEYLDAAVNRFSSEDQVIAMEVLKDMVTSHGTKSVNTLRDIAHRTGYPREKVRRIVHRLVHEARLVREITRQGSTLFELAHEFLVDRIGELLQREDIQAKAIYEMLDRQMIEWKDRGFLLDEVRLETINEMRDLLRLDETRKTLILESYFHSIPLSEEKWFWARSLEPSASTEVLIRVLENATPTAYEEAIKVLSQIGENTIEQLKIALGIHNWKVRKGIINALIRIGPPVITVMIEALDDEDRRVRRGAVDVLSQIEGDVVSPLYNKWLSGNVTTRSVVIQCASMIGTPSSKELLRKISNDPASTPFRQRLEALLK